MSSVPPAVLRGDPRRRFPAPPYGEQSQPTPGTTEAMSPTPDHGEESYRGSGRLEGAVALVTGADSGIGRAIAIAYAREGADVMIAYLSEYADAEATAEAVRAAGVRAETFAGDLSEEATCRELIDQTFEELGGLSILVNNAAAQVVEQELDDFSSEAFDHLFRTNVYAPFYLVKAALGRMPPGGSIINTASIQGYDPSAQLLPYAATKSALLGLTEGMAKLAIDHGVRVNAVAPGPVWTPFIPSTMPEEKVNHFGKNTLLERAAQPAELAPLYVWLASADASYVTAEVFGATGGRTPV